MQQSSDPTRRSTEGRSDDQVLHDLCTAIASNPPLARQGGPDDVGQTFRKILPLCRKASITRLADITGLDRIGLPAVQAVRPAALSEVTSLGRGLSRSEAAIGAVMESLERYYAERIPPHRVFLATADELRVPDNLFGNLVMPHCTDWRTRTIPWINGVNITSGCIQPVPFELVHTCFTEPPPPHDGIFIRSTTGLACHTTLYAAFMHGLFECIERDALARAFDTHGFFDHMRLPLFGWGETVDRIVKLASEWGIALGLWHVPSPLKVPVIWCQAIEAGPGEPILALPTEGYSAGPTPAIATLNAILEALATRAGAISGARDDQTRQHYRKRTDAMVVKARQLVLDTPPSTQMTAPGWLTPPGVSTLVDGIASNGLGPVLTVLAGSDPATDIQCLRTILPGALPFSVLR